MVRTQEASLTNRVDESTGGSREVQGSLEKEGGLEGQYINESQRNIARPRMKGFAWRREYFR